MADFLITGPDGKKYKVSGETAEGALAALQSMIGDAPALAPNMEAARSAKAGTLAMSPASTSRQSAFDAQHIGPLEDSLKTGRMSALWRGLHQGLTFGFGDEIVAAIRPYLHDGETYDSALSGERDALTQARADRPGYAYGGEIAGGVASTLGGAGLATKAPTLAGKAASGATIGGIDGLAYGFGSGEGGFKSRAINAGKTAAIGGVTGGLAPAAIAGAKIAGSAVVNPIASALNIPSHVRASAAIEKMMGRAGMTVDDAKRAISQAADDGQPEFLLADALGNSGQRGLSGIARQPGDARAMIVDMLTARQDGQGNRVSAFLADALGAPDTAAAREASMRAARGSTADAAYAAARDGAGPVDVRGAVAAVDARVGPMRGMGVELDGIDKKLDGFRSRLMARDPSAPNSAVELSEFDRVLGVKQDLGDAIGEATRAGRGNEARELKLLQAELDAALEAASPNYRAANDGFAKASREIDMISEGKASASGRVRADDTAAKIAGMTPEQKSAFAAGYSDPLIAKVESAAPGVNKARPLRNDKAAAELGLMAKDPELLRRQIGRENTMFETSASALGGSKTADNLADIADNNIMNTSLLGDILTGKWGAAGTKAADKFLSAAKGSNPATREIIARALMSTNPAAALAPLAKRRGMTEPIEKMIEALIRSGAIRQ